MWAMPRGERLVGCSKCGACESAENDRMHDSSVNHLEDSVKAPLNADELCMNLQDAFYKAQRDDPTLQALWRMATSGHSEFFVRDSDRLLYRKTQLHGFQVFQLLLPECKRLEVIKLAHDMDLGGGGGILPSRKRCNESRQPSFGLP